MGRFFLPRSHQPGVVVPDGGANCASCKFYRPTGGRYGSCYNRYYQAWAGTNLIPCPPQNYCTDWWESATRIRCG